MIETRNADGDVNGWIQPLWHVDSGVPIEQVYLTVVSAGMSKGPHLHKKRRGFFMVVRGIVTIVWRDVDGKYWHRIMSVGCDPLEIPPGTPAALYNDSMDDAYVINMPYPAWRKDDQDEHPVKDWTYSAQA